MSRSHLPPEQRVVRVNVTLYRETLAQLDKMIPTLGRTRSEVIRNVLTERAGAHDS